MVTVVAPHVTLETHVCNHDFFKFRRGIECATCKEMCPPCNTSLVCHACFSADPRPCIYAVVNVADDVCEDGQDNSADELAAPLKPNKGCVIARMHAKLVMPAQSGKLPDWSRITLSDCLDVLGVRLRSGNNRRQAREIAMQHALPLLAHWDAFVPDTDRVTVSQHRLVAPNHAAPDLWMKLMD